MILYWILETTGSQWSFWRRGLMCSCLWALKISLAAEFWTFWSLYQYTWTVAKCLLSAPVHMNHGQMSVICTSPHEQWPNVCYLHQYTWTAAKCLLSAPVHMNSGYLSIICVSTHEQWPNVCCLRQYIWTVAKCLLSAPVNMNSGQMPVNARWMQQELYQHCHMFHT